MSALTDGNGPLDLSGDPVAASASLQQKLLLKTQALQSAIFNSAYFSSIATDENGVIQIFNVGAERMLGYLAKDVVDRITPADFSDPHELLARAAALSAELRTPIAAGFDALVFKARRGIEDIYEMTYVRKDHSRFPAVVSVTALRDIVDNVIGYLLISTDNTARKLIDSILEAKSLELQARTADLQRFRTAMDATADAITLVSRKSMLFIEANAATTKLLGYSKEELLHLGPVDIGSGELWEVETEYDAIIANQSLLENKQTLLQCKDGTKVHVEIQRQAQRSHGDWIIVCAMRDISERRLAEERMYRLAYYDLLTSLPNRALFYETLKKTIEQASIAGWTVAILFIDMDHFKVVNDTLGHAAGDELLRQFSSRLVACSRICDTVGRLGGDEFALTIVMQDGRQTAANVALKIRAALKEPFTIKGHVLTITASVGITVCPDDSTDPQALLKYADTAMYKAKQAGRDTHRFFTAQMNADALARLELEAALRQAVENSEFLLFYQPKLDLRTGKIDGFEALLRWQRPGHGLVSPSEFIPLLEETGLIMTVGRWVIAQACRQIGLWTRSAIGPVRVSVNVSGRQFSDSSLCRVVAKAIMDNAIRPDLLELELTESSLMKETTRTLVTLADLKSAGVRISIDDFGTGYSSLAYLRGFPIDILKIDMSFIRYVTTSAQDASIVLAIISMAHSLDLHVVAEGVETEAQLAFLTLHQCDYMQGYYFSRPIPVTEVEAMLESGRTLDNIA